MRDGMTHPVLGAVEVDDTVGLSWRASVDLAGREVDLSYDPGDEPLDESQVETLAAVAARLTDLDRSARQTMLADYVEDLEIEGAGSYLLHHVEELGEDQVATALGIATPINAERFVGALRLVRVGVDPDEPMVLDYTIDENLTNYVIAVSIDTEGNVVSINTES
ncbi:DUF2004 domain-containing protein [Actinophytocola sp.]|uniref:DUF2004 domain-containing protein n=1 Tax=Actinophytocola sp. TaxID=1872138 RepID=UPI002ED3C3ED